MAGSKKTFWDLALEITGNDKGATAALKTIKSQIEEIKKAGQQLGKDFNAFTGNAAKLAAGVVGGITAAGVATIGLANSFAETGDKVAKTSAAIGIGIEAYQGLSYAMGQSGVSAEEFDGALQKFNQTVKLGAAGNAAMAKQLADVGLSAKKLAEMKPEEAILQLSEGMKKLPSEAERTRMAVALFGKAAGPKMMAAMKQGSAGLQELMKEAKSLGIVMSDEQAHQSEAYMDAMSRLKRSVTGMKNQFIGSALGPLTEAFDHLKGAIVEQMPAITELGKNFGQFLGSLVKRLPEIIQGIKDFGTWVKETATGIAGFVGGWKNLAKILAGLAVAPTLISGLKVVWSFGNLINTVVGRLPWIMANLAKVGITTFSGLISAALPIIGIIAGIALVVYTVVKNFGTLKQYALDCIERIKSAFGGATGGIAVDWQKAGEIVKKVLGTIMSILEGGVLLAIKTVMNAVTSAIQIVIGAFKVLWNVVKLILWPAETIVKVIIALFNDGWSGAIETVKGQFGKLGEIFSGIFNGIKTIIGGVAGFFINYFKDAVAFVQGLIGGLAEKFGGAFVAIQEKIEAFVNFFKEKVGAVKDFFGGIGDKIGGLFGKGKGKDIEVAAHAEGGIFTHRHIAEIAEKGAEAVVPLNRTPQGFNIWKQAGEIGGYLGRMPQQPETDTSAVSRPEMPPVMQAAAQRISGGENVININFTQQNTFTGSSPNQETINQLSSAGQQAADDIESKFVSLFEKMMRDKKRVNF
jgi:phage-related protein